MIKILLVTFGSLTSARSDSLMSARIPPVSLIEERSSLHSDQHAKALSANQPHLVQRANKKASKVHSLGKRAMLVTTSEDNPVLSTTQVHKGNSWITTDWGKCQTNCGPGYQYRILTCTDSDGLVVDDSQCDSTLKPTDRKPCEGDCLTCEITGKFFSRVGVSGVPLSPVLIKVPDNSMCAVQGEGVDKTCCSASVEEGIQMMYSQLQFGMKTQAIHRDRSIERIQDLYANVSDHLNERMSETDDAISSIQELLDQSAADTKSTDNAQKLQGLRQLFVEALTIRSSALDQALSDLSAAQDSFLQQLDLMNSSEEDLAEPESSTQTSLFAEFDPSSFLSKSQIHFDPKPSPNAKAESSSLVQRREESHASSNTDSGPDATDILAVLKDPNVRIVSKACEAAISTHFQDLTCGACNPRFPITDQQPPRTPVVSIPLSSCDNLYSQCADSLVAAHQSMFAGAQALFSSQGNLMTVATQLQSVLDAVWSEMRFDWLPGFAPSLMAKPSLTSMGCMQNLDVFQPMAFNTSSDFCHNYFSFANPRAFVKRIAVQLDRGVMGAHKFSKCDRCVHETVLFLNEILGSTNRASLRVTLPSRTNAMLLSCGRSSNPIKKAMASTPLPAEFAKMNTFERMSPRVLFSNEIVPLKSLNQYAVANREVFSSLGSKPVHEWKPRSLVNTTVNTTRSSSHNSLQRTSPDEMVKFSVMNMQCTKHSDCFDQDSPSGLRPWWFCAHPSACENQPGACDADEESLLATGPKCVRGPCTNDLSAIDKVCPDNAVCPANGGATTDANPSPYFGLEYFARFDLKTRGIDPIDISATRGVCDCALGDNGEIADPCEYARCLAYASVIEAHTTCSTNLVKQCLAIKATDQCMNDVTLECTNQEIILVYPPENPGECPVNQMALQSESNGVENTAMNLLTVALLVMTTIVLSTGS